MNEPPDPPPPMRPPAAMPPEAPSSGRSCGLAVASLVCGIAGICTAGLGAVAGLILGILALARIRERPELKGQGLAIGGIVTSVVAILLWLAAAALFILGRWGYRMAEDMVQAQQLGMAAIQYGSDHQRFPQADQWPQALARGGYLRNRRLLEACEQPDGMLGYAMNAGVSGRSPGSIPYPSRTVLFFECTPGSPLAGGRELLPDRPRGLFTCLMCFCDGHVEPVQTGTTDQYIWDLKEPSP